MKYLSLQLTKNLRRNILRGHPWVYVDALSAPKKPIKATLARLFDLKDDHLAWGYYDPHSPLAFRLLSTNKKLELKKDLEQKFWRALKLRQCLNPNETNGYRVFNGEGDGLPGLVCDIYHGTAVVQFDGLGPKEFWDDYPVAEWLMENAGATSVIEKKRKQDQTILLAGPLPEMDVAFTENSVRFKTNLEKGQKTGFFLDQRDNRQYVKSISKDKSVLNAFSYTGGFSVYAGLGGAKTVASLDVSAGALGQAQENWELNNLPPNNHLQIEKNAFEFFQQSNDLWDMVIVDPPSMAHSADQKQSAIKKYTEIFALSAKRVKPGGDLCLSSCSSHINFEDFQDIIVEALSNARRTAQIIRVSGQGIDHPIPHVLPEFRYLKFFHLILN